MYYPIGKMNAQKIERFYSFETIIVKSTQIKHET